MLSVMGSSEAAQREWQAGWQAVPVQALLPWAAQMLSLLSLPEGEALLPTLKVQAADSLSSSLNIIKTHTYVMHCAELSVQLTVCSNTMITIALVINGSMPAGRCQVLAAN
jgi:hypothetical protein